MPRGKFLKEGLIYALQPFLERGVAFLLIPIYTAYLSPSSFGQWQFIFSLAFFVLPLMNAGIDVACWHFWGNPEKYSLETVFINACLAKMAAGMFVLLGLVLPTLLVTNWEFRLEFSIYITSVFLLSYFQIFQQYLRAQHRPGTYLGLALSYAAILGGLNILGVTVLQLGFKGILFGNTFANIFIFTVGILVAKRTRAMTGRIDIKLIKKLLAYGFPLIFGNLSYVFISQSDRFFLEKFSSTHELGLYSFGSQFAILITVFIITPLFYWWNPILRWKIYRRADGREIFSRLNQIFIVALPIVTLLMIGGVVFVGKYLVRNEAYLDGFLITPLLAFGQAFFGLYCFNTIGLLFESRTKTIACIVFSSALANIGLNLLFVPRLAMSGAALASFFSFFLMYILSLFFSQRAYAIQRKKLLEGGMAVISTSIALGATYSFSQGWIRPQNIDIIFLLPGIILAIAMGIANRNELKLLINLVKP
jgi:O-antigen/teichoic acid export membrane protein